MGAGGSVEAAEQAPVPHVRVVLQGLQVGKLVESVLSSSESQSVRSMKMSTDRLIVFHDLRSLTFKHLQSFC